MAPLKIPHPHLYMDCNSLDAFVLYFQIADLANEDTPQLYTLCGRGPRSTLRVLRHGLEVSLSLD